MANLSNTTVQEGQSVTVELSFAGEVAPGLTPIVAALLAVPGTATGNLYKARLSLISNNHSILKKEMTPCHMQVAEVELQIYS